MTQRIVRWTDGSVIWDGEADSVGDAIHKAIAARANLSWANLSRANLSGANLSGANLSWADLSRANGIQAERCTPLLMLLDQPGPIRAYKLVTDDYKSPIHTGCKPLVYTVGRSLSVKKANTDVMEHCGAGINVATLDWCLANYSPGWRVVVVEFTAADIAAIPTATDGKLRLHRCTVVAEKDITALVKPPEPVVEKSA